MDKHQTFPSKIGNYPRKSVAFFDFNPRKSVRMNLLSHAVLGRFLRFFEAYHRKSVVLVSFYPRKSVSLQCKLLNVRLL